MKHSLLRTASAAAFAMMVLMANTSHAAEVALMTVLKPADLNTYPAYQQAGNDVKQTMYSFVVKALADPRAPDVMTTDTYELRVLRGSTSPMMVGGAGGVSTKTIAQQATASGDMSSILAAQGTATKAPAVTISLPASGTKALANGYSVNADGVLKNSSGAVVAVIQDNGTILGADGKAAGSEVYQTVNQVFADASTTPVTTTTNELAALTAPNPSSGTEAATQPGAPAEPDAAELYVNKNRYAAATDTGEVVQIKVTNAQINEFIRSHLNSPQEIADAMDKYSVSLSRIQQATGYSRQDMIDYINKSNNVSLQAKLDADPWFGLQVASQ